MKTSMSKRTGLVLALSAALSFMIAAPATTALPMPGSGIVCTSDASPNPTFTLTTRKGKVSTPDGNSILMWSFSPGSGGFQLPGPTLCVTEGDTVTVVLNNTLPEPVSIIFPGHENVLANGSSSQPVFSGSTLTSLAPAAATNGSATYSFQATRPGTFIYESGTDPAKQVQMGLYGAIVVRPLSGPNFANNRVDSEFNPDAEFVLLMSEVDPALHRAVERGLPYRFEQNHPRYWMLNGRSFPDTIAPNGAVWLPTQPYGSLIHVRVKDGSNPLPALVRYLNVGTLNHPFHPHGNHGRILSRDGHPLEGPASEDLSTERFLVEVGSGQSYDVTYDLADIEGWNPTTNPLPVEIPNLQNLQFKDNATWYGGSPYLGVQDDLPVGVTSYNECGEFYYVWHSHALNEAANFEAGFGGLMTLWRVDPPLPNTCP